MAHRAAGSFTHAGYLFTVSLFIQHELEKYDGGYCYAEFCCTPSLKGFLLRNLKKIVRTISSIAPNLLTCPNMAHFQKNSNFSVSKARA